MFVIFLRYTPKRDTAGAFMAAHRRWIEQARTDGAFALVGGLGDGTGGVILAHGETRAQLDARLALDPFVAERIVAPEVHEVAPAWIDERLRFLAG